MSIPLKVKRIKVFKYKSRNFAALSLYFPGRNKVRQLVYTSLTYKIHMIENLRVNLWIGNDIMSPKCFVINVKERSMLIKSCGITIFIDTR